MSKSKQMFNDFVKCCGVIESNVMMRAEWSICISYDIRHIAIGKFLKQFRWMIFSNNSKSLYATAEHRSRV